MVDSAIVMRADIDSEAEFEAERLGPNRSNGMTAVVSKQGARKLQPQSNTAQARPNLLHCKHTCFQILGSESSLQVPHMYDERFVTKTRKLTSRCLTWVRKAAVGLETEGEEWLQKLAGKIKLGIIERREQHEDDMWEPEHMAMDSSVRTSLRQNTNKQLVGRLRAKDRSDRATVETVLDPRTRMVSKFVPFCPFPATNLSLTLVLQE